MITLNKKQIKESLPRIKKGLEQYLWIQKEVELRDVSEDEEFQRRFNYFYKIIPHRNKVWQNEFYNLLENSKNTEITFETLLSNLFNKTGKIEASFVSKLMATLNPELPVIDSVVLKNLGLRLPYSYVKNRELLINEIHLKLVDEFANFLKTENGVYLKEQFNLAYPEVGITKIKMLDLVLWQTRT